MNAPGVGQGAPRPCHHGGGGLVQALHEAEVGGAPDADRALRRNALDHEHEEERLGAEVGARAPDAAPARKPPRGPARKHRAAERAQADNGRRA